MLERLKLLTEQYLEHLKIQGYRSQTIRSYRSELQKFIKFTEEEKLADLNDITSQIVYAFQSELYHYEDKDGKRYSMRTQLAALSTLKGFLKYLCDMQKITTDPSAGLKMPKTSHRLPYVPTVDEVAKLLSSVDTSSAIGFRDRTIMEVLYASGIRAQELCGLKLYDVAPGARELYIREGKGGRQRVVPLGAIAADYLKEYSTTHRTKLIEDPTVDEVFISKNGRPLLKTDMTAMIKRYRDLAKIEGKLSPHSLRHACASHLLKEGCDIRYIQQLLGHASLSTTQVYTKVEISDLKEVHQRCHPREKILDA